MDSRESVSYGTHLNVCAMVITGEKVICDTNICVTDVETLGTGKICVGKADR